MIRKHGPEQIGNIAFVRPKSLHSWECLAVGYLASYSYRFGFSPEQYRFFSGEFDSEETIIEGCSEVDIVAFTLTTFQINRALALIDSIRKINPEVLVVWGGYGVNGLSDEVLLAEYGDRVDYFVQGPGEEPWIQVLMDPDAPRIIRGELVANLDEVPYPDRKLIRLDRHFEKLRRLGEGRKTSMEMQRGGCPFECVFCAARSYTRKHGTSRSPENIVGEMECLRDEWGMDGESMVLMADAEIMLTEQMRRVAELKIERRIEFGFGMNVMSSEVIRRGSRAILERLVDAGLREVWMGVEAGPSLMPLANKPITPEGTREAFRLTRELGLIRKGYFILGFTPRETEETLRERISFIEEIDPDEVGFSLYIPVPGCLDYNHAIHKSIDYEHACEYHNLFTKSDTLSNAELQRWQEYLSRYFSSKRNFRLRDNETNAMRHFREPSREPEKD